APPRQQPAGDVAADDLRPDDRAALPAAVSASRPSPARVADRVPPHAPAQSRSAPATRYQLTPSRWRAPVAVHASPRVATQDARPVRDAVSRSRAGPSQRAERSSRR